MPGVKLKTSVPFPTHRVIIKLNTGKILLSQKFTVQT